MKSIKIILLSFSLGTSLAVTSSAMYKNENENKTIISNINKNDKNNISSINNESNMEIDQSEYEALLNFYNYFLGSDAESKDRSRIKQLLKKFEKLCPVKDKNELTKDIKEMSILDFNQLQSILLEYYNFSVLFTTKYSPFVTLEKTHTETVHNKSKTKKYILSKYRNFHQIFNNFLKEIKEYIKILNNFCYNLLFENEFNPEIQNVYFNNINTKSTKNEELIKKTLEQLPKLTTDLQKIFQDTKTEITSTSKLWGNTFSKDKFKNNTFINENTDANKIEATPNITQDYEIPIDLKDQIPHQYKINAYILAAAYKMELLKSQYYMKKFKDNHLNNENTGNIFQSYDEAKKYANDMFKTYNSLRSFIVLDKGLNSIDSDEQDKTTASEIFPQDAESFKKALKKYTSDKTNNVYDLISFLICEFDKSIRARANKTVLLDFISKSDFKNKYHIDSIPELYKHILKNKKSYNQLFEISNLQDLKEFYTKIDENTKPVNTKSNPKKKNGYKSLNKYLNSNTIECLKNEKTKNEEAKNKKSKNKKSKNKRSHTKYINRNLNINSAIGLLRYYNKVWDLDKDKNRRENIKNRLNKFNEIYDNFYNKYKIQENANISNENFNSLQSILLDYYKFLLFFSKYNNLIKTITTRTCKMRNYEQLKSLQERELFVDKYKSFTNLIEKQIQKIKTFVNEMLTEKFKDPQNTNIAIPENNLTQLLTMSEEILKLEPNFKKIFEIMKIERITGKKVLDDKTSLEDIDVIPKIDENKKTFKIIKIDKITDEKVLDDKTPLEDIDVIPKIDENGEYLNLYSISAAPPHYRVNLDILAAVLKMEIVKWLPYFKKMPNTTVLNDQKKNINVNFTQSKQKMGDYINTIYQFYDKLKSYMVWSMNNMLCSNRWHFSLAYAKDKNKIHSKPKPISELLGKEKEFMKKIKDYIKDEDQFYTTLYLPPDESNDSSEDSPKQLSINLFKMYYDRRQDCVDKDRSQITLFTKHILKKQEIYDDFINNQDPNISDMKLLDLFFSRLDPGYFTILPKVNANADNSSFPDNDMLLLKENKDNKKPTIEQLIIDTRLKRNNSNQNTFTYNNTSNYPSIFQENNNKFTSKNDFKILNDKYIDLNNAYIISSKDLNLQQLFEQNYDYDSYKNEPFMFDLTDYQNDMNNSVYTENRQIDLLNQTANNRLFSKLFEEQALQNNNFIQKENDFIMNPYSTFYNEDDQNNTDDYFDNYYNHENYKLLNDRNEISLYLDELIKINNQINNSLIGKNTQQTAQNQNTQFNNKLIENYEGLTQINQNQQQYIQNIENESEKSFERGDITYNVGGNKEKNSKKTKTVLGQKTFRENTKTPIKKDKPSKKKK